MAEPVRFQFASRHKAADVARRVNPRVRPPAAHQVHLVSNHAAQRLLQDALHRPQVRLVLPPVKLRAVVGDPKGDRPLHADDATTRAEYSQGRVVPRGYRDPLFPWGFRYCRMRS